MDLAKLAIISLMLGCSTILCVVILAACPLRYTVASDGNNSVIIVDTLTKEVFTASTDDGVKKIGELP
jgi:hypothetical protein